MPRPTGTRSREDRDACWKLYLIALPVFFAIDMVWLGLVAKGFYRRQIGFLMRDGFNWPAAVAFYLLFILGLVVFVIAPAMDRDSWLRALGYGALFGLITYATYDLTNLATAARLAAAADRRGPGLGRDAGGGGLGGHLRDREPDRGLSGSRWALQDLSPRPQPSRIQRTLTSPGDGGRRTPANRPRQDHRREVAAENTTTQPTRLTVGLVEPLSHFKRTGAR